MNAEVYVWLPPQYGEPAYRHHRFPVVELLPGYPGSAKAWFGSLHAHGQLLPLMRSGQVAPFILVAPRTNLLAGVDTGCANIPGTGQRRHLAERRRAEDGHGHLPHRDRAAAAGPSPATPPGRTARPGWPSPTPTATGPPSAMSGYNDPIGERDSLTAQSPALRAANNPYLMLRRSPRPAADRVVLLRPAVRRPQGGRGAGRDREGPDDRVYVVFVPRSARGHTTALWRPQVVPAFRWLTEVTGCRPVTAGGAVRPRSPSSAGATPAELASGTASRAGAARSR